MPGCPGQAEIRNSKRAPCALLAVVLGLGIGGCGNDGFLGGSLEDSLGLRDPQIGVVDAHGNVVSGINLGDPVTILVPRLASGTEYVVRVTDPNGVEYNPAAGVRVRSDQDGTIYQYTVVQDLDSNANPATVLAPPGDYRVTVATTGGRVVETIDFEVRDNARVFCSDVSGTRRASFVTAQNVYAAVERGGGTLADGNYDVHVRPDLGLALVDGGALPDASATVTVSGGVGIADLGAAFAAGSYDVIVDLDGDDLFDAGSDLISRHRRLHSCFTVQAANTGGAIVQQVAADRTGNFRHVFDPLAVEAARPVASVHTRVTPSEVPGVNDTLDARTYIVAHRDAWSDGDALTDATGTVESGPLQDFSLSQAPTLAWLQANLTAGCYDAVIDVNANGTFDAGVDIVDNLDAAGNPTCGLQVADTACSTNIQITSHDTMFATLSTAITLQGTLNGSPSSGLATITAGAQSTTVGLPTDANLSATVPLFNGVNYVTLAYDYAGAQTCARTLVITQGIDFNALFRVQLLWDGSTDMDLHVVRPGGQYENGGGGADDCNYANCNVGPEGTGTNSIDWGEAGEHDDPKLDVDCIACGTGIENIWMSEINQNGEYSVFVDAFSGSEDNVSVKIFIGGAEVAEVACGAMSAGTATDSCSVGSINWNGRTGSFTADGTKADDF